jgi:hypothetical protein
MQHDALYVLEILVLAAVVPIVWIFAARALRDLKHSRRMRQRDQERKRVLPADHTFIKPVSVLPPEATPQPVPRRVRAPTAASRLFSREQPDSDYGDDSAEDDADREDGETVLVPPPHVHAPLRLTPDPEPTLR